MYRAARASERRLLLQWLRACCARWRFHLFSLMASTHALKALPASRWPHTRTAPTAVPCAHAHALQWIYLKSTAAPAGLALGYSKDSENARSIAKRACGALQQCCAGARTGASEQRRWQAALHAAAAQWPPGCPGTGHSLLPGWPSAPTRRPACVCARIGSPLCAHGALRPPCAFPPPSPPKLPRGPSSADALPCLCEDNRTSGLVKCLRRCQVWLCINQEPVQHTRHFKDCQTSERIMPCTLDNRAASCPAAHAALILFCGGWHVAPAALSSALSIWTV